MLPVTPDKPNDPDDNHYSDDRVELVEILAQFAPVLAQLHSRDKPAPGTTAMILEMCRDENGHAACVKRPQVKQ